MSRANLWAHLSLVIPVDPDGENKLDVVSMDSLLLRLLGVRVWRNN